MCFEQDARELPVSIEPLHVLSGDFAADAYLEVIAVGLRDGAVAVELWSGSSEGPVEPSVDAMITGCSAYPVAGPILGSDRDDLVVSTCSPTVDVHPGAQSGFQPPIPIELPIAPRSSVVADVDADGDTDLVVLGDDEGAAAALAIVARAADGSLESLGTLPIAGLTFDPTGIRGADFDANGNLDLVLFRQGEAGALGVVHASAPAAFATPVQLLTQLEIFAVATGDFDGDGDDDLAFADSDARLLCAWIVDAFADPAPFCWPAEDFVPAQLAAGDIDDDGDAELAVSDRESPRVWIWDVDLAAETPTMRPLATPAPAEIVELVDLQGDGRLDLLAGHLSARSISVRLGAPL